MLTRRVIAADITNLTDARYFAARGVDYLMFDLSQLPLDKLLEIKEWVEGPSAILLVDDTSINLVEEAILKVNPAAVISKNAQVLGELQHFQAHVEIAHLQAHQLELDGEVFKQISAADVLSSLDEEDGIILSGGDEEIVGLKDFDLLDTILDEIEEN